MLLRLRVRLPDRPGSLGQVARTLGVTGADIVQMVVLERVGGRAVDDFTVIWPAAAPVDRILGGLGAIPGVAVEGVWRSVGAPAVGGADAELVGQVAANPDDGLATLVDAVPGLLSADWAAALVVPADWAQGGGSGPDSGTGEPGVAYASWRAPQPLRPPDVTPLRPRAFEGVDGVRFGAAPLGRGGVVLLVARGGERGAPQVPAFHVTEVDRLAQLVRASALVLGARLEEIGRACAAAPSAAAPRVWPVNTGGRLATAALDT
ncbi:MAG TPA: amino acid-binding protein [Rugosimonospora sp.]|nr:amino acid-binding protein [Rugosimonospora sp.]